MLSHAWNDIDNNYKGRTKRETQIQAMSLPALYWEYCIPQYVQFFAFIFGDDSKQIPLRAPGVHLQSSGMADFVMCPGTDALKILRARTERGSPCNGYAVKSWYSR